jgi:hypothetical protein
MALMRVANSARSAGVCDLMVASRQVWDSPVFQLPKAPARIGWLCNTYQPFRLPGLSPS